MAPRKVQNISKVVKELISVKKFQKFKQKSSYKIKIAEPVILQVKGESPYRHKKIRFDQDLTKFLKLRMFQRLDGRPYDEIRKHKPAITSLQMEADLQEFLKNLVLKSGPRYVKRTPSYETLMTIMEKLRELTLGNRETRLMDKFGSTESIMRELKNLSITGCHESMLVDRFGSLENIESMLIDKFGSMDSLLNELQLLSF